MSIDALNWVLTHSPSKGAERLVMIVLANYANEAGESYPGMETIAEKANLSFDCARRSVAKLEKSGQIVRVVNGAPDERIPRHRRPNLYTLVMGGLNAPPNDEWVGLLTRDGWDNQHAMGGTKSPTKEKEEPKKNERRPRSEISEASARDESPVVEDLVELFADMVETVKGKRPKIGKAWKRDMRLLLERGDPAYEPNPVDPDRVRRLIEFMRANPTFPSRSPDFAWPAVVQSPNKLRAKYEALRVAASAERSALVEAAHGSSQPGAVVVNRDHSPDLEGLGELVEYDPEADDWVRS